MPDDRFYFAALAAARQLLDMLDTRPDLARPARLAVATYAILDAIKGDAGVAIDLVGKEPER